MFLVLQDFSVTFHKGGEPEEHHFVKGQIVTSEDLYPFIERAIASGCVERLKPHAFGATNCE